MKKRNRGLSLVLSAAMAAGLILSGCGGGNTSTTAAADGTSAAGGTTAAAAATEAPSSESGGGEKITIRIGHSMSEDNIYQVCAEAFRDKAVELLGADRVEVIIYPNAVLGTQTEMIEAMQMGTLDAVAFGRHSQIDSRLDVLNLPYLFSSDEHMTKVLRGDEGASIRERVAECFDSAGIKMLGMFEAGFRQITSSRKIEKMEDLKGLVIRTPNTPVLMDSFSAWGANPTPLDFSELYTALQTKVVDAQENPYQLISTSAFYEVQDYLCVTNHSTICDQLQFSKKVWDTYPADVQEALAEAGKYACDVAGEENTKRNSELLAELKEKMEVTEMPAEEVAKMKDVVMEKVWPDYLVDDFSKQLVADIQALAD